VASHFVVERSPGPAFDASRPLRAQHGWDEHATFMDGLVEDGLIVLGGPLGEVDRGHALHVVQAESAEAIRDRLSADPWEGSVLVTGDVRPWTIWLRSPSPSGVA
jgi:uncharacterized protein